MPKSATLAEIESYAGDVLKNDVLCELPSCPRCGTGSDLFKRHEHRRRGFRILLDMIIKVVVCFVIRWKCPACKKTFTQQPPFALPLKRYTCDTILGLSELHLEDDTSSYRRSVLEDGASFLYAPAAKDDLPSGRELAHSTLYQWITSVSTMQEVLRGAQDILLQQDPVSTIHHELAAIEVSPRKYVKAARESILKRCRQLIHLEAKFRAVFSVSIFPRFAAQCGWR